MKDKMELIEQGYLIEALSPRAYGDLVYWLSKKDKRPEIYQMDDVICSLPLPFYNDRTRELMFERLLEAVNEKEKFERRIATLTTQAMSARMV